MPSNPRAMARRRATSLVLPAGSVTGVRILGTGIVAGVMFLLASAAPPPAAAQGAAPSTQTGACEQTPHRAETPPARGADSGTKPGSEGSSGWTGGTGGTYTGLTPQSGTPESPTRQPEVVTGLDPKASDRRC